MADASKAILTGETPAEAQSAERRRGSPAADDAARVILDLTDALEKARAELRAVEAERVHRDHAARVREARIRELEHELALVVTSRGWRALGVLRRLRDHYWRRGIRFVKRRLGPPPSPGVAPAAAPSDPRPEVRATWNTSGAAYAAWLEQFDPPVARREAEAVIAALAARPVISILMPAYNSDPEHLEAAIDSVCGQLYPHWELCIADDASPRREHHGVLERAAKADDRVRVRFLEKNEGIAGATNAALAMASGAFIGLLDHDDVLAPNALYEAAREIHRFPDVDMIYSDEDKIGPDGQRRDPFFKPDWSPTTFLSYMYTCHFGVYRRSLVERIGGFRPGYDGSQDYDLVLRLTEQTDRIRHIPRLLYHWRMTPQSTAQAAANKGYAEDAARKALADAVARRADAGGTAERVEPGRLPTTYRVRYRMPAGAEAHLIIPTKNNRAYIERCVGSILAKTAYPHYRVHIVDNGSTDAGTLDYFRAIVANGRVDVLRYDLPFNYSAINNWAVGQIDGRYLLLLNDDTEVVEGGWLEAMLEQASRPEVGAVGAKLVYPDGRIQHGGVILGIGGVAGHAHKYFPRTHHGYFSRLEVAQNLSAVTAACLMIRREVFERVGGLNERDLAVAFNDVDLCLRIREAGYQVVYTPYAELIHHESVSRGLKMNSAEIAYMRAAWGDRLERDPYYNVNLTLVREDFSLCP